MKTILLILICILPLAACRQQGQVEYPKTGSVERLDPRLDQIIAPGVLPEIVLSVPANQDLQKYLGLSGKKTFTIPEIKTEVVIIEIFSMY